jgi:L-alanine-DL-glutamate epimerase-like enolase superfamily enzyme
MRFADIEGAPFENSLMKIYTNQGVVGYGEVRDLASKKYALMLKSRILHENPCDVERLFHRIKQFGGPARQGGGVSAVEIALLDIVGKVYNVPIYQLLGGKYRDEVRVYCDTDVYGKHTGKDMGQALLARRKKGFKFLKMDVGIDLLLEEPGTLSGPSDFIDLMRANPDMPIIYHGDGSVTESIKAKRIYDLYNVEHPFTRIQITEKGLEYLENYVAEARSIVGFDIPLSIDHFGHIGTEECIKLLKRLEKYNISWAEDLVPWQDRKAYQRISRSTTVPICTGEDIYLAENFSPLLEDGSLSVAHPDVLTVGGIMETKRVGMLAERYHAALAIHNAESPIAFMAAIHAAAATRNFIALEHHSNDVGWWNDIVEGSEKPIVSNGYAKVPQTPGLGIEKLNDDVIKEHINPRSKGLWESTEMWDDDWSHDRLWS